MNVVSASIRMLMARRPSCAAGPALGGPRARSRRHPLDLLDRAAGGFVERDAAVGVLHAVALEDLEALLLPGAGDAEDRDLLGGVVAELQAGLDHAARDDVHTGVRD